MNVVLGYINEHNLTNDKYISKSYERKILKTFDFFENESCLSGVINYIWKNKKYELLITMDDNKKIKKLFYKIYSSKSDAFNIFEDIYNVLNNYYGEK